ncbi:hypothetical protein ACHAWF_007745 [Thalassiosira exigua]
MDALEYLRDDDDDDDGAGKHRAVADVVVIPQTALEECRHRSLVMHRRATDLARSSSGDGIGGGTSAKGRGRRKVVIFADAHHADAQVPTRRAGGDDGEEEVTPNDENDARLRRVAHHYGKALRDFSRERPSRRDAAEVVFLSDDRRSRELAGAEQPPREDEGGGGGGGEGGGGLYYAARSMRDHVTLLQREDPTLNLLDMVAQFQSARGGSNTDGDARTGGGAASEFRFPPHAAASDLSRGLRGGKYHQGIFHTDRDSYERGYVTVKRGEDRVAVVVRGIEDVNRAVDGDVVAVELHPLERWLGGGGASAGEKAGAASGEGKDGEEKNDKKDAAAGIAAETAEPSVKDSDNIAEEVPVDDEGKLRRPCGKVIGIIRRNFRRNYCGSVCTVDAKEKDGDEDATGEGAEGAAERDVHPHDALAARHEREHPDGASTVVFVPVDPRVPPVLLRTAQRERLEGMRVLVAIDSWPSDSELPLGHYVGTLGKAGEKETETGVLLNEFRIPCEPFPAKVRDRRGGRAGERFALAETCGARRCPAEDGRILGIGKGQVERAASVRMQFLSWFHSGQPTRWLPERLAR